MQLSLKDSVVSKTAQEEAHSQWKKTNKREKTDRVGTIEGKKNWKRRDQDRDNDVKGGSRLAELFI